MRLRVRRDLKSGIFPRRGTLTEPVQTSNLGAFRMPARRLLLFSAALSLLGASVHAADNSLYDSSKAAPPSSALSKLFGPKAGNYSYDPRMIRAAEIAKRRAQPHKTWYCWRYVKDALLDAGLVSSRPTSPWAKDAGRELCAKYGFVQLKLRDPRKAPVGAVVVYGGADAGHVELRTREGFVSDFISPTPYPRPLVGIFVKPA
jgi:hypothetical protein